MTTRFVAVEEAVALVEDGMTVLVGGSGAGHAVPQLFIDTLESRFRECGHPRELTTVRVVGIGDFGSRGFSQLAIPGLMRRTIGSNIGNEPRLAELVQSGEMEAYSLPQGVLSQLTREIAAGRPGLVTHVGLGTYVDPRQSGGKQNARTREDLVEVIELAGREWLFYHSFPIHVAVIRASTADEEGNLSMEGEAVRGEMLSMAMAAHNCGGVVIAQVGRLATAGSLSARSVEVPGALVDYVYVDPDQRQTYDTGYSPYYAGALRRPLSAAAADREPTSARKVIARRALMEFNRGDICNLGFGISQEIGSVAFEEGIADEFVLTVEQGVFGGVPAAGNDGGAGLNYQALLPQPSMFDFYDGGGLDVASLSFAEVDAEGNVNVHAFGGRLRGPGGFPNISARTRRICFVGTLTAGGLRVDFERQRPEIRTEGSRRRFVSRVEEVSFNAKLARARGQRVRYITERAVFELHDAGVALVEVAEGIDVGRDVLAQMCFQPVIANPLRITDPSVFAAGPMGLAARDRVASEVGTRE